ncbi:clusterin-associated protein 1-like [Tetranychus urticae]|nr:clusterin-associated protein 1-like [Tetranychus urticae]
MSFRELRNFSEILRFLGYPRLVSIDNFRKPNFPLVAEILRWLITRFDSSLEVPYVIETEQDRVIFVKTCAQLIATKALIKLNTKKIYTADGHAVQEMMKMASLIYQASKQSENVDDHNQEDVITMSESLIHSKSTELKKTRQLASKITQKGALLSDLLEKEIELREKRVQAMNRQLAIPEIEKSLRDEIKRVEKEIENINYKIEHVASDEANLDVKIEKKQQELERYQKRLATLKSVRPAFMDEYEKLEEEMATLYDVYVTKFRSLVYLDWQLEDSEKTEIDKMKTRKEQINRMIEQMRKEESLRAENESDADLDIGINLGELEDDEDEEEDDDDEDDVDNFGESGKMSNNMVKNDRSHRAMINSTTAKRSETGRVRVFGSMIAGDRDDSLDSDLDLDGDDDPSELDSEDERELRNIKDINNRKGDETDDDNDF